ncbi:hypothetical protein RHSIM_Rhsim01G0243300 [Rhododendron simsii]|uniref:Uncharacterized protein n=1 Tax=Rhododendron simsii TaxID=118357 RepID=A0A834LYJ3_RHOSS|nr:hypothetical protein RHSIM_Rhsim01G0243300 [Rhododendron simsii]
MSHRPLDSRRAIDSCTFQLHSWKPFHLPYSTKTLPLDSADSSTPKPYQYSTAANGARSKRPCLSDRATTSFSVDISRLSLIDDDRSVSSGLRFIDRKRRRQRGGSRSVSGRSSDRSGTQRRCCSVGAANGTCSDFPVAAGGTDSSGELFLNGGGEGNWASDVSEAAGKGSRREREERDSLGGGGSGGGGIGVGQIGNFDSMGNESGYGSEPGYRGDAELGDGDEVDEEEEDQRLLFWGQNIGGTDSNMEMVGENTLQKTHHRCRRKKNDVRMVDPLR